MGWITDGELTELGRRRVAIAGLGGVGGSHLLTLTRLGIGRFSLAEMDAFELANFNRQAGARCSTIGMPKLDVMAGMAQDINPELDLRLFPEGLTDGNIAAFLAGADLYVDSLDFFAFAARRAVFAACNRLGIPAITAAPLGMGAAMLCFRPGGMTFEDYFRLDGCDPFEQSLRLLVGLAPAHLHAGYLADRSRVDLAGRSGPSTAMACELCAGIAGSEALRILLRRPGVRWAPHGLQFDAYRHRLARTWMPWGNANPMQRLRLALARRILAPSVARGGMSSQPGSAAAACAIPAPDAPAAWPMSRHSGIVANWARSIPRGELGERLRRAARLAPTAENRCAHELVWTDPVSIGLVPLPWVRDLGLGARLLVEIGAGAMAENLRLVAAEAGLGLDIVARPGAAHAGAAFRLTRTAGSDADLAAMIPRRCTNRRPYEVLPLPQERLAGLLAGLDHGVCATALDEAGRELFADAAAQAEGLRLRVRSMHHEMYAGIRCDRGWHESCDVGIPLGSLEIGPALRPAFSLMRHWSVCRLLAPLGAARMHGWRGGSFLVRRSGAIVVLSVPQVDPASCFAAGQAMQRIWLRATAAGLAVQPMPAAALYALPWWPEVPTAVRNRLAWSWRGMLRIGQPIMALRLGHAAAPSVRAGRSRGDLVMG